MILSTAQFCNFLSRYPKALNLIRMLIKLLFVEIRAERKVHKVDVSHDITTYLNLLTFHSKGHRLSVEKVNFVLGLHSYL